MATIKFWQEMRKATSVDGQDKVMIGKNSNGEAMYVDFQYLVNQAGAQTSDYIPIDGNTLPTLGTESKFSIVGGGTYTQSVGGDVVVPENSLGIIVWDGDEWSLGSFVEMSNISISEKTTSNQLFNSSDFFEDVGVDDTSGVMYQVEDAMTTKPLFVGDFDTVTVEGLKDRIHTYAFTNSDGSIVNNGYIPDGVYEHTFQIPIDAHYFYINFKRFSEVDDSVLDTLFIYGDGNHVKDAYANKVTINGTPILPKSGFSDLYKPEIPDTIAEIVMNDGEVESVIHNSFKNEIVRTDEYTYLGDEITEERELYNGEKLKITTNINTLKIKTEYYGV